MPILCATNFSTEAVEATTVAAELARQRGEELWLVFVLPKDTARVFGDQVMATAEGALKGEAARVRKLGATVHHVLLIGKLHRELPAYVVDHKIGLVIAGDGQKEPDARGSGALVRLAEHLSVPLLVVREGTRLIAWAKGERPLKVMLGMDHGESTHVSARWLTQLAGFGKVEVVGAHIFWPPVEHHRLGLPLPRTWDETSPELMQALRRELLEKLPLNSRLRVEPAFGRPSDHLIALAQREDVDLLVVGAHPHRALGRLASVSEQCLQGAPMSVAFVPAPADAVAQATVPRVERVLIATDFSPTGVRAIGQGLAILADGGTAELVHVVATPQSAETERALLDRMMSLVPSEASARGVKVKGQVLVGLDTAACVLAAAERFGSQVICLGSRGYSGLAKLVLGSTAQSVLSASRRPVLIVRPPEP